MDAAPVNTDIEAIGALQDPRRRALYAYVSRQHHDVSRDEAAWAVSISRGLASFHLDRLVRAGLLQVSYRRLSGRQGPGAGRPSKLYRRTDRQISISVPERRYELLAQLFAGSLQAAGGGRIINLSGGGGASLRPRFSAYATAKCGLVRFSETIAAEVAAAGIPTAGAPGVTSISLGTKEDFLVRSFST